jgi:hypothetical protein
MKNKLLSMGMLAGLLTLALVMFGCDHNPRPWNGESGGGVDPKIVGDWWDDSGTLSFTGGGEIQEKDNGEEKFTTIATFTASGGIIKANMEGQIMKGGYSFSGADGGTLSITLGGDPEPRYKIPSK